MRLIASSNFQLSALNRFSDSTIQRFNVATIALAALLSVASSRAADSSLFSSAVLTNLPHAEVVIVENPTATTAFEPRLDVVRAMINRGLTNLTGKPTQSAAWLTLVSTQDIVGLKVFSTPGPNSGTRPAVVTAIVEGLLAAGLPPHHIIVWDKQTVDLRLAGYFDLVDRYQIRVVGSAQAGYDEKAFYDKPLLGNLVWGDLEFGKKEPGVGRKSFVSKVVSREMTKIINVSPLLNHNSVGVSGNLYGLAMGSVDNIGRFESDDGRLARAVPEIYALPSLSDKVVLNIVDALICQYEGGERGLLHYSTTLNQLRFSRDPVALDVLSIEELQRQRRATKAPVIKPNLELYETASLLELGVSDLRRIDVRTLHSGQLLDLPWR
jgi:hypothetical protein